MKVQKGTAGKQRKGQKKDNLREKDRTGPKDNKKHFHFGIMFAGIGIVTYLFSSNIMAEDSPEFHQKARSYNQQHLNNDVDFQIWEELERAGKLFAEKKLQAAIESYTSLVTSHPLSPRASFGLAVCIQAQAEMLQDPAGTEKAITLLNTTCFLPDIKEKILTHAISFLFEIQRMQRFEGDNVLSMWDKLYKRYPKKFEIQRSYSTILLAKKKSQRAKPILEKVIEKDQSDSLLVASLGIQYFKDQQTDLAAKYLKMAIDAGFAPGLPGIDRFYLGLTFAYNRLGDQKNEERMVKECLKRGYILSNEQRSVINFETPLTARPWWTMEQTTYQAELKVLEDNWETIRDEALSMLKHNAEKFRVEEEGITEVGDWRYLIFYKNGKREDESCRRAPKTCHLLKDFKAATECKRGQIKLSVLQPGIHIWPHSGPTNCRLRAHLGLKVPEGPRIRVGSESRTWTEGKILIFDDSFVHEVWHNGTEERVVLIVDFWHPDLTETQWQTIGPIKN